MDVALDMAYRHHVRGTTDDMDIEDVDADVPLDEPVQPPYEEEPDNAGNPFEDPMEDAYGGGDRRDGEHHGRPDWAGEGGYPDEPVPMAPPPAEEGLLAWDQVVGFDEDEEEEENAAQEDYGPPLPPEPIDLDELDRPIPRPHKRKSDESETLVSPPRVKRGRGEKDTDVLLLETPLREGSLGIPRHGGAEERQKRKRIEEAKGLLPPPEELVALQESMDTARGRPGEPWLFEAITGRNVGPFSEVSSYEQAVKAGPESVAAWYHDLEYDKAQTMEDFAEADRGFLQRLQAVPKEDRGVVWNLTYDTIASGVGRPYGWTYNTVRDIIRNWK